MPMNVTRIGRQAGLPRYDDTYSRMPAHERENLERHNVVLMHKRTRSVVETARLLGLDESRVQSILSKPDAPPAEPPR
jgi:hypothetical protein